MLLHGLKSWRVVLWRGAGQVVRDLASSMTGRLDFSWELGRSPAGWETGQGLCYNHTPLGGHDGAQGRGAEVLGCAKRQQSWQGTGMVWVWPTSLPPPPAGLQGAGD